MKKINLFFILLMFSFSFASACGGQGTIYLNDYDHGSVDVVFVSSQNSNYRNDYVYDDRIYIYENEDRYPAIHYIEGYSYRLENDYYERKIILDSDRTYTRNRYHQDYNFVNWLFSDYEYRGPWQREPFVEYEYVAYLDKYEEHECYEYPPRDKIIYRKC